MTMSNDNVTIKTNNVPRDLLDFSELTEKEQVEFDYVEEPEWAIARFVRYKGVTYDLHEFTVTTGLPYFSPYRELREWDAYQSDSFFSGIVMRHVDHSFNSAVMGTYYVS